jgi:hypothetical protein
MKLCHAAALALAGWYLMMPPLKFEPSIGVDLSAPLSRWSSRAVFDGAQACNEFRTGYLSKQQAIVNQTPSDRSARLIADQALDSQCISSDDPRLKAVQEPATSN